MADDLLITLPSALLILQFCMMLILFIGVMILSHGYIPSHGIRDQAAINPAAHLFLIITFAVLTMAPLFFTGKFSDTWSPVFGAHSEVQLKLENVKLWIFASDIVVPAVLVARTRGWKASPFTSVVFSIPAFAILLRESPLRVGTYTLAISAVYGLGLWWERASHVARIEYRDRAQFEIALWTVGVMMLALTTLIGVLTRGL